MINKNRNFTYPKSDPSNTSKIKTKFMKSTYNKEKEVSSEYSTNESSKPVQINIYEKMETIATDRFPIPANLPEEEEKEPIQVEDSVSFISYHDEVENYPDLSFYQNDCSILVDSKIALKITNFTKFSEDVFKELNKFRNDPFNYLGKLIIDKDLCQIKDSYKNKTKKTLSKLLLKSGLSKSGEDLMKIIILHEGYQPNSIGETLFVSKVNMINSRVNKHGLVVGEPKEIVILNSPDVSPVQVVLNIMTKDDKASQMKRAALLDPEVNYIGICCDITPNNNLCTVINLVSHYYQPGDYIPRNLSINNQPKPRSNSTYCDKKTNLTNTQFNPYTHLPNQMTMINPIQSLRGSPNTIPSKFDLLSRFSNSYSSSTFSSKRSNTHKVNEANPIIKLYLPQDEK